MAPNTRQTRVLVVGAGPVGLALAGNLGRRGIGTMLVERTDGPITQPKMELIVRPDGFVARRGDAIPGDPIALIDIVRGALMPADAPTRDQRSAHAAL